MAGRSERFFSMGGCLVKMDVLMRSADAVPVEDLSYMEYTFKPAKNRDQQITVNTFEQDATHLRLPFVDMS